MATPRLHINVIPSMHLIKSHYIDKGVFTSRFSTVLSIDSIDFQNLDAAQRSLVFRLFEDSGALADSATIDLITNIKLISTRQIVHALIELLARDDQAMLDKLAMDWDARVVQFADPDPDPGF
jgi:hypothetical protein